MYPSSQTKNTHSQYQPLNSAINIFLQAQPINSIPLKKEEITLQLKTIQQSIPSFANLYIQMGGKGSSGGKGGGNGGGGGGGGGKGGGNGGGGGGASGGGMMKAPGGGGNHIPRDVFQGNPKGYFYDHRHGGK